jgi:phosphopentomutase
MVPGTLDYAQAPTGWWGRWTAARTVNDVRRYLAGGAQPHLLFVHLGEPDFAGHAIGWMSWPYGVAVRRADAALGQLVAAGDAAFGRGGWTLLVTADHGGHGRTHGSADVRDVTIPWIAWGAGVVPGPALAAGVRTMDTAATLLWLFGIARPADWVGRPVACAFGPVPAGTSLPGC